MICEGLRTLLLAHAGTIAVVGTRIFVGAARQGQARPYILIDRVSDEKFKGLDGVLPMNSCEVEIVCWHNTASDAASLAKVVGDYLGDFSGATGGDEAIKASHHVDEDDTFDPPPSGGQITEWATILTFEFQYTG
jgi:hypothetical protein